MSASELTDRVEELAHGALDGTLTTARRRRLTDLLAEDPDPGPIELYETWHGSTPDTSEDAASRSAHATGSESGQSFDPAEDDAHNRSRVLVRRAYTQALDAGMDEAAEYLRGLSHPHQQALGRLLRSEYLEDAP